MVFAHADDETLLAGALISKLVRGGSDVRVLCLAPGDEDRESRLRSACEVLGVSSVETLRYSEGAMWPDESGRASTADLGHMLSTAPVSDLVGRIRGRIVEYEPNVIVTHSPYGDYGHADHAAVYRGTFLAAESILNSDLKFGEKTLRVYSLDWPKWIVRLNARLMRLGGRNTRRMGTDGRFSLPLALQTTRGISISMNVAGELSVRQRASRWYAPEIAKGPLPMQMLERLPLFAQRVFLGKARLRLVLGSIERDANSESASVA